MSSDNLIRAVANISSCRVYCKIPKISPGAYIFQGPFLRGLFLEGLIFEGAHLRREICVSQSIGLALQLEVNLLFFLCFTLYLRAIFQVQAPGGGSYLEGRFNGGFFALPVGGFIFWGAYFRNFTVCNTEDADVPSKHVWKIKESCYVHTTIYIVAAI